MLTAENISLYCICTGFMHMHVNMMIYFMVMFSTVEDIKKKKSGLENLKKKIEQKKKEMENKRLVPKNK